MQDRVRRLEDVHCPITGRRLRLRRAWPRDAGHILLEYADDQGRGTTVAGQWFADEARLQCRSHQTAAAAPSPGMVALLDDVGVLLQRGGADRRLRPVAGAVAEPGATLLVHRPERRAVVRLVRPGGVSYLKAVRPGRLPSSVGGCGRLRTPPVIGEDRLAGTIEYGELPGRSLHDLLGDPATTSTDVAGAVRETGAAVRRLHGSVRPAAVATHDAAAERGVVGRWLDQALTHGALPHAEVERARASLDGVDAALHGIERPEAAVVVHRDLHDKQVLVDPAGGVGLLDLDTMAMGDPALDVANFLAHLELRVLQGHCSTHRAGLAGDAFVDGYRPDRALLARIPAYLAATRLRLACVYAFRPFWRHLTGLLIAAA